MKHYDVVVVGLGAMGSAALYQVSGQTKNVLGIDQFSLGHHLGSSGGETRITRVANGEGELYTSLVLRANQLWREIESKTGESLLLQNGALIMATQDARGDDFHGRPDFFAQTIATAQKNHIKHDVLAAADIQKRFPQFTLAGTETGYYEYDAGYLWADACLRAQLNLAKNNGATIHTEEKVLQVTSNGQGAVVTTNRATYAAERVIMSPGPWIQQLMGAGYKDIFKVYRQTCFWWNIQNNATSFSPQNFPTFIWIDKNDVCYGFPAVGGTERGIKMGFDYTSTATNPDAINRRIDNAEKQAAYQKCVAKRFADIGDTCLQSLVCMLTFTSDAQFIIDTLPDYPQIVVASPCSGGGVKHSAAVGQLLAELAIGRKTFVDITEFSLGRFKG